MPDDKRRHIRQGSGAMADALSITDGRTGRRYELPIQNNTVSAAELNQIRVDESDPGLRSYDPALVHTAACTSRVCDIDGERGILRYRGYRVEELVQQSNYLETAYLIVKGDLPDPDRLKTWRHNITVHTMVHENIKKFMEGFRYDAHPMGILVGTVGALSTFYPEARDIFDLSSRKLQTRRLIAKLPTIAAFAYRRARGLPYIYPDNSLEYCENFLAMMFRMGRRPYRPNPTWVKALEAMFIVHAEHEQNCSTNAVRAVGSAHVDPFSAVAAGCAALAGPRHGGANEAVIRMLEEIGSVDRIPEYIRRVKAREFRLMGFGHRVYKTYDPRAQVLKSICDEVLDESRPDPLFPVAQALEKIALEDDFFRARRLFPNVDFYSGLIYRAMGIPENMFPVMFAIPRTSGWLAHWAELVVDPEQRIHRPRQVYAGATERAYVPVTARPSTGLTEDVVRGRL